MSERLPVVFLVDVDNTLLDNDHIQNDLRGISNVSLAQLVETVTGRSSRPSLKSWAIAITSALCSVIGLSIRRTFVCWECPPTWWIIPSATGSIPLLSTC